MEEIACDNCGRQFAADAPLCIYCGAANPRHRSVPWYHLHRRLYNWTLNWANRPSSSIALFVLAFAESSFFPVPPDVLLMPLVLGQRKKWFRFAALCSAASVLGGAAGYCIGAWAWTGIETCMYDWFSWAGFSREKYLAVAAAYEQWNFWVVFTAGFTPLPFKLITITAGVFGINFAVFLAASVISRSARFFLVAVLMHRFGPKIRPFVDKYFNWLSLLFVLLLVGGFIAAHYLS